MNSQIAHIRNKIKCKSNDSKYKVYKNVEMKMKNVIKKTATNWEANGKENIDNDKRLQENKVNSMLEKMENGELHIVTGCMVNGICGKIIFHVVCKTSRCHESFL